MPIHPTFNFIPCSQPKSRHASPNHHWPTSMLHNLMNMLRSNAFSISNPTPWPTISAKPIYICLVTENHVYPIINASSCFTIWWTCWGPTCSPSPIQHHDLPSELNLFIFVSSLKIMCFQSSMVQFSYLWANLKCARTCLRLKICFLRCICSSNPTSLKACLTTMSYNNLLVLDQICFVVADAVSSRPSITRVTQFTQSARSFGRPQFVSQPRPLHPSWNALQKIGTCPLKQQLCK